MSTPNLTPPAAGSGTGLDQPAAAPGVDPDAPRPARRQVGYTDAHGRPELVMHPQILRGSAQFRALPPEPDDPAPTR